MKKIYLSLLVVFALNSVAQDIPAKLDNTKTDKYVNIEGTEIWFLPPAGFSPVPGTMSYKKDDVSGLQVKQGGNFEKETSEMTIQRYEKENIIVNEFKFFKLNGKLAKFFWLQEAGAYKTYILVWGDSQSTYFINAKYSTDDKKAEKALRKSLLSIVTEKAKD